MKKTQPSYRQDMANALVAILDAAEAYATATYREHDTHIGEECVLGPEFAAILGGVHGLLNGETGNLDRGHMRKRIYQLAKWARALDENGELP